MKLHLKIYAVVLAALVIGGALFYVNKIVQRQTVGRLTLLNKVGELEKLEKDLDVEILRNSFFLYPNYDPINDLVNRIDLKLAELKNLHRQLYYSPHPVWNGIITRYEAAFSNKKKKITLFLTANATIKNSSMYIPVLVRKCIKISPNVDLLSLERFSDIASLVLLAKNSLAQQLVTMRQVVARLDEAISSLQHLSPVDPRVAALKMDFIAHLQVFVDYFPKYSESIAAILAPTTADILRDLRRHITKEDNLWLDRLNLVFLIFLAAFLTAISLIIVLLVKTDHENIKLVDLQKSLIAAATSDRLTGLANRFAFDTGVESFIQPFLFLVNLDDFKHINDLYGVRAGDFVLCAIADRLREMLLAYPNYRLFRLGGDDFGILIEKTPGINKDLFAQYLLELIENENFTYKDQSIAVTISIGVSAQPPLLETADMALKRVKQQSRLKYLIYNNALNIQAAIANNLNTLSTIRHALKEDGVLVYFQPIVDNLADTTTKYECLIRMRAEDGTILGPYAFLDIAKESPLYTELTAKVIDKSFQVFKNNDCEFSINLSVADILDERFHEFIIPRLDSEPDLARRLTFEILESEGVENYEAVHNFIRQIKERGCRIAIDDFGPGYSNFAHILRLQVDTLKIDASLIKHLDTDSNAKILVRTIIEFSRKLNIQTVAEFVHSESVYQAVCALGIDYSQGYYLGKPMPDLPGQPTT